MIYFRLMTLALLVLLTGCASMGMASRPLSELTNHYTTDESRFIAVDGLRIHYRDEGSGPVLVLLHGVASSLHTWDGWVAELSQTRRVIRFDLPGFGLTGPAADGNYSLAAYVDFVIDVMDTLGIERFVLAGNSLGGSIAWRTTAAHPQRIEKLILVDSGGYPFEAESMPLAFVISQTPLLNRIMEFTLPRSAVESSVRDVYGDPSRVTPELVDRYFDLSLREGNRGALRERFAQLEYQDQSALVQTIQQPTLVIWGAQDRLIPPSIARRFEQDLPNGQLVMFAELGHVPHEEAPTETVAAVTKFL